MVHPYSKTMHVILSLPLWLSKQFARHKRLSVPADGLSLVFAVHIGVEGMSFSKGQQYPLPAELGNPMFGHLHDKFWK